MRFSFEPTKSLFFAAGVVGLTILWFVSMGALAPGVFLVPSGVAIAFVTVYLVLPIAVLFALGEYTRRQGRDAQLRFRAALTAAGSAFVLLHLGGGHLESLLERLPAGWPRLAGLVTYVTLSLVGIGLLARYRIWLMELLVGPIMAVGPLALALTIFLALALDTSDADITAYTANIQPLEQETSTTAAPIYVIVFDELSWPALLDSAGEIDAARFPNFASLASNGVSFTEARANYFNTRYALPALAESLAETGPLRAYIEYGGAEVALNDACDGVVTCRGFHSLTDGQDIPIFKHLVLSTTARLIPPPWSNGIDGLLERFSGLVGVPLATTDPTAIHMFNEAHIARFLSDVSSEDQAGSVYLFHSLVTHHPYIFEADGTIAPVRVGYDGDSLDQTGFSLSPPRVTEGGPSGIGSLEEAYLTQISYADFVLGRILQTLEEQSTLGQSTVVVTADHGVRPILYRDRPKELSDLVTHVPLIVSAPDLEPGIIDGVVQQKDLVRILAQLTGQEGTDVSSRLPVSGAVPWFLVEGQWLFHFDEPDRWRFVAELERGVKLQRTDQQCLETLRGCRFPITVRE